MSDSTTSEAAHRAHPAHGIQVFSDASDAPRVRRITDGVTAFVAAAILLILALVADDRSQFDDSWTTLVVDLPGWVLWAAQAVYVATIAYTGLLILGVAAFARGRLELVRDLVLALLLASGLVALMSNIVDERWPALTLVSTTGPATTFPAFFIAATTAVQAAAAPHLSAPLRRFGWGLVLVGAGTSLLGNVTRPSDVVAALLVGIVSAAIIRLTLGTTAGLPTLGRVAGGLTEIGVELDDLRYLDQQPKSSALLAATTPDGTPALVKVLGRDAWDARRFARLWRFAWYEEDAQYGHSRREQVEHEALTLLMAQRSGTHVPDLLGVGLSSQEDAFLVTTAAATTLGDLDPDHVDDGLLDSIWQQVATLRSGGLSHGRLDATTVGFDRDGEVVLLDFTGAAMSATEQQRNEDDVELLVTTALIVGADRALAAGRRALGDIAMTAILPVMQPAALSPHLRHEAKRHKVKVADLRKQAATDLGVDEPELEKLQRVDLKKVAMSAFGIFAVYTIISMLADVGFDTIADALREASWVTLLLALLVVAGTNITDAVSLVAISPKPVPVGPAALEQFAISFVNVAVPTSAGRIAVNLRFFQKFGISPVASTSSSMIASAIALLGQVILLVLAIVIGKHSIDLSSLELGGGVIHLVELVAAIVVGGLVVVLALPKLRHAVAAKLREPVAQLRGALDTVKQPRNLLHSLAGTLASQVLYAAGLVLTVQALGGSLELGEAIFINVTVSLFSGLSPVPGGIGIAEAGITAGLVAVGIPNDTAVSAALLYRMVSYYLPPIWGWGCMQWLQKNDYL